MDDAPVRIDASRAAAIDAAVSAGAAESQQDAVDRALDAWLADQALERLSDADLQKLWREGVDSGVTDADFDALKVYARQKAIGDV